MIQATHIDPVAGVALDEAGKVVDPNPMPALVAAIVANIHKVNGGDPGAMTRLDYYRSQSSITALGAALPALPRFR